MEEPSTSVLEEMKDLKEENAELREDNDKLLSYLDGLEERKKELEALVEGEQKLATHHLIPILKYRSYQTAQHA